MINIERQMKFETAREKAKKRMYERFCFDMKKIIAQNPSKELGSIPHDTPN